MSVPTMPAKIISNQALTKKAGPAATNPKKSRIFASLSEQARGCAHLLTRWRAQGYPFQAAQCYAGGDGPQRQGLTALDTVARGGCRRCGRCPTARPARGDPVGQGACAVAGHPVRRHAGPVERDHRRSRGRGRLYHAHRGPHGPHRGDRDPPTRPSRRCRSGGGRVLFPERKRRDDRRLVDRSEEHTSELQSRPHLVCRLLLEKKKKITPSTRLELKTLDQAASR